jgi:hypothetical protein
MAGAANAIRLRRCGAFVGEIRNPKLEIRNKPKIQRFKFKTTCFRPFDFWILAFEFVSDFEFRASGFPAGWAGVYSTTTRFFPAMYLLRATLI